MTMLNGQAFKKFVLAGIGILLSGVTIAQRDWPSELWHDGKVVLTSGDTLKGNIKYDFNQDLVQYVVSNRTAEIYSARKVLFFEIFDETVHKYRRFFALPYTNPTGYKASTFFELLEEGKMTLLSRELLEYKVYNSSFYGGSYSRMVQTFYYFFLKEDGTIEDFKGKKNDLLDLMGNKVNSVEKYIKANRLDFDDKYDVARMVAYYNTLFGT
ncbi:MAG: hypothetical protein ABIR06_08485 [Cyclobacteriaceae bacterium]